MLLANIDANYKFITIDVGSMGRFSDGLIFANSELGKRMEKSALCFPNPKPLQGQDERTPYVLVGDEVFPLMENLMRPYPKPQALVITQKKIQL